MIATMSSEPDSQHTLYPPLERSIEALETSPAQLKLLQIEKAFASKMLERAHADPKEGVDNAGSILPTELLSDKKPTKIKIDPLKRIKDIKTDEAEDEEEQADDEEEEDEEQVLEDEEEDAGGDYLVSHFDNGEGFEDNDDEGDDITM